MSAVAEAPTAPAIADARKAGDWLLVATAVLLCVWVLLPIYLLIVNALSSPQDVTGFPKRFFPSFDLGSLAFFINFAGVA
ncbi:MAG: carbohydrate ABC transporter permease, partial [Mesorhizobium sp.]